MSKNQIVGKSGSHQSSLVQINLMRQMVDSMSNHEERIANLEDTMRISSAEEHRIQRAGNKSVIEALGGKESKAYKELRSKTFAAFWSEFKRYFVLARYDELPAKQYREGMEFATTWQPKQELKMLIKKANTSEA